MPAARPVDGLVAAAESFDRCCGGGAEAFDSRFLAGQVGEEGGRVAVAVPVGQVTGGQQGQGRIVGGRAARPSLSGGCWPPFFLSVKSAPGVVAGEGHLRRGGAGRATTP